MAYENLSELSTLNAGKVAGRISRKRILVVLSPPRRAAVIYPLCFSVNTTLLTTRVTMGTYTIMMTMRMLVREGPTTPRRSRAKRSAGIASRLSKRRIKTSSSQPP
jgi:hypothetical protein